MYICRHMCMEYAGSTGIFPAPVKMIKKENL